MKNSLFQSFFFSVLVVFASQPFVMAENQIDSLRRQGYQFCEKELLENVKLKIINNEKIEDIDKNNLLVIITTSNSEEVSDFGENLLQCAVSKDDLDAVKLLIKAGANVNYFRKIYGINTMLDGVLFNLRYNKGNNSLPIIREILEAGYYVNAHDRKDLYEAIRQNQLEVVKLLIEYGVDIKSKDNVNWAGTKKPEEERKTPLEVALELGHNEIARFLIESGARE